MLILTVWGLRLVALLTESVDRNVDKFHVLPLSDLVALLTESVDRNILKQWLNGHTRTSLSSRRAWIEIILLQLCETVHMSLSSRRAWIEIVGLPGFELCGIPSLSSRRAWIEMLTITIKGTSARSLSSRRAWIEIKSNGTKRSP